MSSSNNNVQAETAQHSMLTKPVSRLLPRFAIPAIAANLVAALYNIVDQIFIGNGVGYYGNAATNIAFPITTICMAIGLLIGVGSASNFNLELGKGNPEKAKTIAGTALGTLVLAGVALVLLIGVFMRPMLLLFGATDQIFSYAKTYVGITIWGIPFLLISTGGNQLVRADGSPRWSMLCMISGAVINTILDPLFIFVFHWGVAGAAAATIIEQLFSSILVIAYLPKFKSSKLSPADFIPRLSALLPIVSLGLTALFNQLSLLVVQLVLNNLLRNYGSASAYGSEIPLAVAGIVTKVNTIFSSVILGISNGLQPIAGVNYGAGQYGRVQEAYRLGRKLSLGISIVAFLCFQLFTAQIIDLFGSGDALYVQFACSYLRIFLFCTFLNGVQTVSTIFFSVIGEARKGAFLAITRQVLLLTPCLILFAFFLGIDGIKFAGPAADIAAFIITMWMIRREFSNMQKQTEGKMK